MHPTRPTFSLADAAEIAASRFGVAGTAEELNSYDDQNFRIRATDGKQAVLKVTRAGIDPALLHLEHVVMNVAEHANVPVPSVLPTTTGEQMIEVESADARVFYARMISWMPGLQLADATPHSSELLRDLGAVLARLDNQLATVRNAAAKRELAWSLTAAHALLAESLGEQPSSDRRDLLGRMATALGPAAEQLATMSRQLIHNDANDYNVLVSGEGDQQRVSGLIDFGDAVESPRLAEPAIAAGYAMLHNDDPLAAAAHVFAGYHAVLPLSAGEQDIALDCALLRLCQSVVMSTRKALADPDNTYASASAASAWRVLGYFDAVNLDEARAATGIAILESRDTGA